MNQTHKEAVKDAERARWKYVFAITEILVAWMGGLAVAVGFGWMALSMAWTLLSAWQSHIDLGADLLTSCTVSLLVCGALTYAGIHTCLTTNKKSKKISYVPPVAEQIAALPAEEVLLRHSDQPAAAPGELLRAAQQSLDTPQDELLRPIENKIS